MRANRTQWAAQTWGQQPGASDQLNADEDAVAALCKHYNVPLVSQRAALLDSVAAPRHAAPHRAAARRTRTPPALHAGVGEGSGREGRSDSRGGRAAFVSRCAERWRA